MLLVYKPAFKLLVVQSLSRVWLFEIPGTATRLASLSFTLSQSLFKLMTVEPVMPSNHLVLCYPLLLLPLICPSIKVFSNELALHIRWSKYWSYRFSPSNEYSALIFFRMDWFDFLAAQGTLRSLLQYCIQQPISIGQWRCTHSTRINSGITRVLSMSSSCVELLKGRSLLVRAWPMWSMGKGMANYFSILALRTPWTIWKGKKIWQWKMSPQVGRCPICYWGRAEK